MTAAEHERAAARRRARWRAVWSAGVRPDDSNSDGAGRPGGRDDSGGGSARFEQTITRSSKSSNADRKGSWVDAATRREAQRKAVERDTISRSARLRQLRAAALSQQQADGMARRLPRSPNGRVVALRADGRVAEMDVPNWYELTDDEGDDDVVSYDEVRQGANEGDADVSMSKSWPPTSCSGNHRSRGTAPPVPVRYTASPSPPRPVKTNGSARHSDGIPRGETGAHTIRDEAQPWGNSKEAWAATSLGGAPVSHKEDRARGYGPRMPPPLAQREPLSSRMQSRAAETPPKSYPESWTDDVEPPFAAAYDAPYPRQMATMQGTSSSWMHVPIEQGPSWQPSAHTMAHSVPPQWEPQAPPAQALPQPMKLSHPSRYLDHGQVPPPRQWHIPTQQPMYEARHSPDVPASPSAPPSLGLWHHLAEAERKVVEAMSDLVRLRGRAAAGNTLVRV